MLFVVVLLDDSLHNLTDHDGLGTAGNDCFHDFFGSLVYNDVLGDLAYGFATLFDSVDKASVGLLGEQNEADGCKRDEL